MGEVGSGESVCQSVAHVRLMGCGSHWHTVLLLFTYLFPAKSQGNAGENPALSVLRQCSCTVWPSDAVYALFLSSLGYSRYQGFNVIIPGLQELLYFIYYHTLIIHTDSEKYDLMHVYDVQ